LPRFFSIPLAGIKVWTRNSNQHGLFTASSFVRLSSALALDFAKISPVKALFYTAVINGLLAPFLLVGVLLVANRSENHAQTAKLTLERRLSVHHVSVDVRGCNWNVLVLKAQRRTKIFQHPLGWHVGDYRFHNARAARPIQCLFII
jgi:hypothetical protein